MEGGNRLETYSVYDDRGLLRWVLSPEASSQVGTSINETILQRFAYRYDYDGLGRMTVKRLPGCDPVYMVYDRKDRLVMSQDGNMRATDSKKWCYTLYDDYNRMTESGEVVLPTVMTHTTLLAEAGASDLYVPVGTRTMLQRILYDTYQSTLGVPVHGFVPTSGYATDYSRLVTGKITSLQTRVLETEDYLTTTTYYDDRGRVIQVTNDNIQGGKSRVDIKYDFVGNVLQQRESHQIGNTGTDVFETINTYDDWGRLLTTSSKLNNGTPAQVVYTYDAIGRLTTKQLGSVREMVSYNSRGWLTGKESIPFKMKLRYESPQGGSSACYNGNISEWEWQQGTSAALMYGFSYDGVNRLKETIQKQKSGTSWGVMSGSYLEKGITYDRNGNIKTLQRTAGGSVIDNLVYTYTGNQLTGLVENVRTSPTNDVYSPGSAANGSYTYDKNGNMITDSRRVLNFKYNALNLLSEVKTGSTSKAKYTYLADGAKLRVRDNGEVNGFDYLGSLTYRKSSAGLLLETANFGDGVIRATGANNGVSEVNYFLVDHLGSVRVIVDGSGAVKERNDYYPFGARHVRGDYAQQEGNRLKYNGKEEQVTGDLDFLDYGWRMYDDGLGKWFGMDLLAEKHYNVNPYMYCVGNPVNKFDPNGQDWYVFNQSDGMFQQKVNFEGTHRLVIHSKEKLKGGLEYDSYRFVDFADPIDDPMNIDGGNINQVIFVSEEEMISMLEEQGAFDVSWFKFAWESQGGGDFDYSFSVLPLKYEQATGSPLTKSSSALFLPEGDYTAHNQMNFGNYLWGATGYAVGFEFGTLKLGAHLNSLVNSKRNGYRSQLDSDDDQRSIIKGAYHAYKMNYRNRRK